MTPRTSHLKPDGTTFPPVTPDPPPPPGYRDPFESVEAASEEPEVSEAGETTAAGGEHQAGPGA